MSFLRRKLGQIILAQLRHTPPTACQVLFSAPHLWHLMQSSRSLLRQVLWLCHLTDEEAKALLKVRWVSESEFKPQQFGWAKVLNHCPMLSRCSDSHLFCILSRHSSYRPYSCYTKLKTVHWRFFLSLRLSLNRIVLSLWTHHLGGLLPSL